MRPKKKSLSLVRETIRELTDRELSDVNGGIDATTVTCGSLPPTQRNSCFNSCYWTDCCLLKP